MKMPRFIPILISVCLTLPTLSVTAYAENLDKDTIVSEIWSEWWLGQSDNGRTFPEASYKHHILEKWVDENYDDYEGADISEIQHNFKRYYKDLIENWDFNDDDNGNWTIDTDTITYHFSFEDGKWLMIDSNGDIIDTFMPFSTLEESKSQTPKEQKNSSRRVKGRMPQKKNIITTSKIIVTTNKNVSESRTGASKSNSNSLLYVIVGLILAELGTIGFLLYKRNKK